MHFGSRPPPKKPPKIDRNRVLGASWALLGRLRAVLDRFGSVLGRLGDVLGHLGSTSWTDLEHPNDAFEGFQSGLGGLGVSWKRFGASWGKLRKVFRTCSTRHRPPWRVFGTS